MRSSTTPGSMCAMHALMPQDCQEQKACRRVCRWVCGYWLSVHCPAHLFTHSAVDRPVCVGKGREVANSLLYCRDFELTLVYSPDFDRLFHCCFATCCGAIRSATPASSNSVWRYRPRLAAPEVGPAYTPLYGLTDGATHLLSSIGEKLPHLSQWNEAITVHRLERTTAYPLYLPEILIS